MSTNIKVASRITAAAEIIKVYSRGGYGTATFYDNPDSDDVFIAKPDLAWMLHDGSQAPVFQLYAYDFAHTYGLASGSSGGYSDGSGDIAQLYDTAGHDVAVATTNGASIANLAGSYLSYASKFDYVNFWATAGGIDSATFLSSPNSDDVYVSSVTDGNQNKSFLRDLNGNGEFHFNVANRFERSTAFSTGGQDIAHLYDTFGDDVLVVDGNNAAYMHVNNTIQSYAEDFTDTLAISHRGGTDAAQIYDAESDDVFTANAGSSTLLLGGSFSHTQVGFDSVIAIGRTENAGNDVLNNLVATNYTFVNGGGWETVNDGTSPGPVAGPIPGPFSRSLVVDDQPVRQSTGETTIEQETDFTQEWFSGLDSGWLDAETDDHFDLLSDSSV